MAQESFNYRAMLKKLDEKGPRFDYIAMLCNVHRVVTAEVTRDSIGSQLLELLPIQDRRLAGPLSDKDRRGVTELRKAIVSALIDRVEAADSDRGQRNYLKRLRQEQEIAPLPGSAAATPNM